MFRNKRKKPCKNQKREAGPIVAASSEMENNWAGPLDLCLLVAKYVGFQMTQDIHMSTEDELSASSSRWMDESYFVCGSRLDRYDADKIILRSALTIYLCDISHKKITPLFQTRGYFHDAYVTRLEMFQDSVLSCEILLVTEYTVVLLKVDNRMIAKEDEKEFKFPGENPIAVIKNYHVAELGINNKYAGCFALIHNYRFEIRDPHTMKCIYGCDTGIDSYAICNTGRYIVILELISTDPPNNQVCLSYFDLVEEKFVESRIQFDYSPTLNNGVERYSLNEIVIKTTTPFYEIIDVRTLKVVRKEKDFIIQENINKDFELVKRGFKTFIHAIDDNTIEDTELCADAIVLNQHCVVTSSNLSVQTFEF
jgi:hypothetical protein